MPPREEKPGARPRYADRAGAASTSSRRVEAMQIAIVGAGHIGQALARLARSAGHEVTISNSRGPETLADLARELDVVATAAADGVTHADLAVVTVPFTRIGDIDPAPFVDRLLVDTNNYYPTRDGRIAELDEHRSTTSEIVQRHFDGARVVKAFNAILATDLVPPFGMPAARRALPVAGDDPEAVTVVRDLHADFGLDTVDAGPLADSWRFERAKPSYCIPLDEADLRAALASAERDVELPHNSWHRTGSV
ncbi:MULTISPECIES: NADPH-dependent F420 reductase [unclassified Aeromicrobium]|uniref:NADPH-dependent F420 reductase n=1 Tax=unclassified Aeromicrobium TaxID=2633570 RepID=UPI00396B3931